MRLPIVMMIPGLLACLPVGAAGNPSVVRFSNDDRIPGEMASLDRELLIWESPILEKPTPFFLKEVVDLSLQSELHEITADHLATVSLTNGDTVVGQLASATDDVISLDTWFAGRLNFNRLMVRSVDINAVTSSLYRGPTGLDGWIQSEDEPAWTYDRLAFRSRAAGGIAHADLMPDVGSVEFDVAWKADSLALKVLVFSDKPESTDSQAGYDLQFQRGMVYLRSSGSRGMIGNVRSQAMLENDRVRVKIEANQKTGQVCLHVDDELLAVWSDPDVGNTEFGTGIHFISSSTQPIRISGIEVGDWDGLVEAMPAQQMGALQRFGNFGDDDLDASPVPIGESKEGRMELANGDTLSGEVQAIQDGVISVKTPLGDVKLPVARLRTLALKPVDLERCIRRNGDIRGWFPDGSSIVFRLDEVGDGTFLGSSQNFGVATFRIAAFSRVEFNIYDQDLDLKRGIDDW